MNLLAGQSKYDHSCMIIHVDPPLIAEDLKILCKWEHFKIWKIIGTELGIDADVLKSFESDQKTDYDCLCRMIIEAKPPITYSAMTKVLQSERITNAVAGICMYILTSLV